MNETDADLARKGKLLCPSCNNKMIMYYKPYCIICNHPLDHHKELYNLQEMQYFIEIKYNIRLRDYASTKFNIDSSSTHYNTNHRRNWENNHFPIIASFRLNPIPSSGFNEEGIAFYYTNKPFFENVHKQYRNAPDGECKEIPYWDFWHFLCDYLNPFSNDCVKLINWTDVKELAKTDWQHEICDLFITEFGDQHYYVEISW